MAGMTTREPATLDAPPETRSSSPGVTCRGLTVRVESADESNRTVEAVLVTDTPATVRDLRTFEILDEILVIGGADLPDQVPLYDSHPQVRFGPMSVTTDEVHGSARGMRVEGNSVVGTLHFSGDAESLRRWEKVREGHIDSVSVGTRASEFVDIPPGTTQEIGGRSYSAGPNRTLRISTVWKVREVSLVAIGADENAKIREGVDDAPTKTEGKTMNPRLRRFLDDLGLSSAASDAEAVRFLDGLEGTNRTAADAIIAAAEDAVSARSGDAAGSTNDAAGSTDGDTSRTADAVATTATVPNPAETARAERERVLAIQGLGGPEEITRHAIAEGSTREETALAILTHERTTRTAAAAPNAIVRQALDPVSHRQALSAGIAHQLGLETVRSGATDDQRREQERIAESGDQFRGMSLLDVCRESVRMRGGSVTYDRRETVRAAVSSGDLVAIFSPIVNLALQTEFEMQPDSTQGWTSETNLPDFKENERPRIGKDGGLKRLPRGATAQHASWDAIVEKYKAIRYAKQFNIDEQDIIDDSQNALRDTPRRMGNEAAQLRPDLVYSILLANAAMNQDGVVLFHAATHSNLLSGGTSVLSGDAVQDAMGAMKNQREDGRALNLRGLYLIVPPELEFLAQQITASAERGNTGSADGTLNPLRSANLQVRSDSRISTGGVVDPRDDAQLVGTATNWFLSSSQPMIEVGFVGGQRTPRVRSYTLEQGQWGVGWDVNHDIGAQALDYRGLQKSAGA